LPLPELGCEIPSDVVGKWPKQALWGRELFGLQGLALYVDLDSVLVDSIDPYFTYGDPSQVYVAQNWVKPFTRGAQTSIFRFRIGEHSYMLDRLRAEPARISRKYQFEQDYVGNGIWGGVRYWPRRWTRHFRIHCMGPWPLRYLRAPKLPRGCRCVTFPGHPKPPDAIIGRWSERHEARTPVAHLRWAFSQRRDGKALVSLKRYLKPTPWVAEHWRA